MYYTICFLAVLVSSVRPEATGQKQYCGKRSAGYSGKPKSCYDYLLSGVESNGYYQVFDNKGNYYMVFCDFKSEVGHAYTLVMSFTLENSQQMLTKEFRSVDLAQDRPVNEDRPNWFAYRLSKPRMEELRNESQVMRYTCSASGTYYLHSYRDYLRVSLQVLDPLRYLGYGKCFKVDYINVRGTSCADCNIPFWQTRNGYLLHTDLTTGNGCSDIRNPIGRVESEDNFGYYATTNNDFHCSRSGRSTTNLWIGN